MLKIVHIANTPLAGSPIRIVDALNSTQKSSARLITLDPAAYGSRIFSNDLDWKNNKEECIEVIRSADILHFHHYFSLSTNDNPFQLDFSSFGKPMLRQFHSHPSSIASWSNSSVGEILKNDIPSLVIAQFHERFYPGARVVPNIVTPVDSSTAANKQNTPSITFSPSTDASAWAQDLHSRWDTKGKPEILEILTRIKAIVPKLSIDVIEGAPHHECIKRKANANLAIDELVTGSYHLSSLESMAMGIATMCYLDERTEKIIREISGADELPWINCRLEDSFQIITSLLKEPNTLQEIGLQSSAWMRKYWNQVAMAEHYNRAYQDLLNNPEHLIRKTDHQFKAAIHWRSVTQFEEQWKARSSRHSNPTGSNNQSQNWNITKKYLTQLKAKAINKLSSNSSI